MGERFERVRAVFEEAVRTEPVRRAALLERACADDAELRAEVEAMLRTDGTDAFLDHPLVDPLWGAGPGLVGRRIAGYRVVRRIGGGGMGAVYEATREDRNEVVAIKVMRPGLMSPEAVRRFEYESRALGRLRHPGIARVHEAGTWREEGAAPEIPGLPFFVMELVAGARSLTEYADRAGLEARDRVALLADVCDAVHHGHQHGVIHRDLKPANILVDESGHPKVIDFGVARSTDADLTAITLATGPGQLVGTLRYMSPEQCRGDPRAIDTRTDVYSLGVVLYELLTGSLPYELGGQSLPEVTRRIAEAEPARPSSVRPALRGDLETILLRALEKDPDRRYASASALGTDLRRFLDRRPIAARPPSAPYQLRLLIRRHRAMAAAAVTLMLVLAAGAGGLSIGLVRAMRESEARRVALDRARESEARARAESTRAEAIIGLLEQMITSANPDEGHPRDYTVRRMLDDFAAGLERRPGQQPEVLAAMHRSIGNAYYGLGELASAERHLRADLAYHRARGASDEALGEALIGLAPLLGALGRLDEAESAAREALAIFRARLGPDHERIADALSQLGTVLHTRGDSTDEEAVCREALGMRERLVGPDGYGLAPELNNLAMCLESRGDDAGAEPLMRRALALLRARHGPDHKIVAEATDNLAAVVRDLGRVEEAEALYREALRIEERALEPGHILHATTCNNLAYLLENRGDLQGAAELYARCIPILRRQGAIPYLAVGLDNLGRVLMYQGRYGAAEPYCREALALARSVHAEDHRAVTEPLRNLRVILRELGRESEIPALAGAVPPVAP